MPAWAAPPASRAFAPWLGNVLKARSIATEIVSILGTIQRTVARAATGARTMRDVSKESAVRCGRRSNANRMVSPVPVRTNAVATTAATAAPSVLSRNVLARASPVPSIGIVAAASATRTTIHIPAPEFAEGCSSRFDSPRKANRRRRVSSCSTMGNATLGMACSRRPKDERIACSEPRTFLWCESKRNALV